MRSKERAAFTPADLCGLIAHETAAMLYGVGADSIPSAKAMRTGLETFAAAAGAVDVSTHLAWIDSELESALEFERTGRDTPHLLTPDRLNAVPEAVVQMEAVWELFSAAVRMPDQQSRQAMRELAVTMAEAGGLGDALLGAKLEGPYLSAEDIRAELEESRRSMEQEHRQMVSEMETQYVGVLCDLVKKLTGVLINDKKDVLLHLIRSSISDLKPSGHYTLRVSPEDLTLVENHLDEIQMDMESGISLDVREEKGLEKNECIIETDTQMVDCGFRTQLGNLITTLHMLA